MHRLAAPTGVNSQESHCCQAVSPLLFQCPAIVEAGMCSFSFLILLPSQNGSEVDDAIVCFLLLTAEAPVEDYWVSVLSRVQESVLCASSLKKCEALEITFDNLYILRSRHLADTQQSIQQAESKKDKQPFMPEQIHFSPFYH